MTFEILKAPPDSSKIKKYVTVNNEQSIGGAYFCIIVWWNDESSIGFWEPWETGVGRYADRESALEEALIMAEMEDLPFYDK